MWHHTIFRGSTTQCTQLLPVARHKLRRLLRRLQKSGGRHGEDRVRLAGGDSFQVRVSGRENTIEIDAGKAAYQISGRITEDDSSPFKRLGTRGVRKGFRPQYGWFRAHYMGPWRIWAFGGGFVFPAPFPEDDRVTLEYLGEFTYPEAEGFPRDEYSWERYTLTIAVVMGAPYRRGLEAAFTAVTHDVLPEPSWLVYYSAKPRIAMLGRTAEAEFQYVVTTLTAGSEAPDAGGAPCPQAVYEVFDGVEWRTTRTFPYTALPTNANRRFMPPLIDSGMDGEIFVVLGTDMYYDPAAEGGSNGAQVRFMHSADHGDSWTVINITEQFKLDHYWYTGVGWPNINTTSSLYNPQTNWHTTFRYNFSDIGYGRVLYIGGGEVLFFFVGVVQDSDLPRDTTNTRIMRLSASGVETVFNTGPLARVRRVRSDGSIVEDGNTRYFHGVIHLGGGRVLAKTHEIPPMLDEPGTGSAGGAGVMVRWYRSDDRGSTWEELPGAGLPDSPDKEYYEFESENFGQFTLLRKAMSLAEIDALGVDEEPDHGFVVVPVYEPERSTYALYGSRDAGDTWQRLSTITASGERWQVPEAISNNEGNNFNELYWYGTPTKPAPYDPARPGFMEIPEE